ncbi:hypothetical protein GCM10027347_22930 [Larkinella harenae]
MVAACTLRDPTPSDRVCLVTEIIRYQQLDSVQQEISRQNFNYENGNIIHYTYKTPGTSLTFNFKYLGGKVASVYTTDSRASLHFDYDHLERVVAASYIVDNREQTVFTVDYPLNDVSHRVSKIVETRGILAPGSQIGSRIFQFSHQPIATNTQDVVSQTIQNIYKDGSRTEEVFTYEQDAQYHSPFYDSSHGIIFSLLALTNSESNVAPYLQRYFCKSVKREMVNVQGAVSLSEFSQFTTDFDVNFNPVKSNQFLHLTIPKDTFPADRHYQHLLQYNCIE